MSEGKDQGQRTLDRTVGLLMDYPKLFNLTSMKAVRSLPQYLLGMSLMLNRSLCNSASVSIGFLIRIMK